MAPSVTKKKKRTTPRPATSPASEKQISRHYRLPLVVGGIIFVIGGCVLVGSYAFGRQYDDRILPHTRIGAEALGNLTYAQAQNRLINAVNTLIDTGVTLTYQSKALHLDTIHGDPANPELATTLIDFDIDTTLQRIRESQQNMTFMRRTLYAIAGIEYQPVLSIDIEAMTSALQALLQDYEVPAIDAGVTLAADGTVTTTPAQSGTIFSYPDITDAIADQLLSLRAPSVAIVLQPDEPNITEAEALAMVPQMQQAISAAPFTLRHDDLAWEISADQARTWMTVADRAGAPVLTFAGQEFADFMNGITDAVTVPVQEARFQMDGGRVVEFQPSQTGVAVDSAATMAAVQDMLTAGTAETTLVVNEVQPSQSTGSLNTLGIKELIGEGRSNFKGSPANRRHNIAVGAETLNGLLIKPNEEFSLIKALGAIDGEHGYLQELVIKGNKTIPEYGGGLCQIGTTTFRSVLDAGLKVTERRNHSYRVSYYEPAGTDATIYDPAPDFKFVNDTANHVLLTTEIDGDELIFRLYGTSDGRRVAMTKPYIYNLVAPGPTKLIETTDVAPGVKKCTESAHTGADAEFSRTITYADGEVYEETFRSHYKPWQAVCLIGVDAAAASETPEE